VISGSANSLEQIIVNLLLNARDAVESKFQAKGKNGTIGQITLDTRLHPQGNLAMVEISDNGTGIEQEDIPQIFNPFFTTKQSGKGTGLGLSVSLGIAQAHGGFIDVQTVVGQGSTFSLILPLNKVELKSETD
jgi:two-component system, NtrC family, sensor kinase